MPALRERAEDIPMLVEHFLRLSLERCPRSVLAGLQPNALDFLAGHPWPGNVRQLGNLIERLVVTASSPLARLVEVKEALGPTRDQDPVAALLNKPLTLQELQDRYTDAVLEKVLGSKSEAAKILGIDLSTLYRREKQR